MEVSEQQHRRIVNYMQQMWRGQSPGNRERFALYHGIESLADILNDCGINCFVEPVV